VYAIIETGGKQYRVEPEQVVRIEKLDAEVGDSVEFDRVLMVAGDDGIRVGNPVVDGAKVIGAVVEHGKAKKIYVFRYKAKKRVRTKTGHRQPYTAVKIRSIAMA
jgi:large subunit ribosomal protein L21